MTDPCIREPVAALGVNFAEVGATMEQILDPVVCEGLAAYEAQVDELTKSNSQGCERQIRDITATEVQVSEMWTTYDQLKYGTPHSVTPQPQRSRDFEECNLANHLIPLSVSP